MDADEIMSRARVVALPMRERFRGILTREALLIEGEDGHWREWSPFIEYDDAEAAGWLRATVEQLALPYDRADERPPVRVNATVPAIPAADVPALLARFPGVRTAKVKVAERGQTLQDDLDRVAAVRAALGPLGRVRVDANGLWSLNEAEDALLALARYDLEYAEQPVAGVADLAELRSRIHPLVPIAADESIRKAEDPLRVVEAGAADVVILKFQPLGGAGRALRIMEQVHARDRSIAFVTSSALETSVGLAAALRFASVVDAWQRSRGIDLDHGLGTAALFAADVAAAPLLPEGGAIPVRWADPDPALLDRFTAAPERRDWWLARLRRCLALLD